MTALATCAVIVAVPAPSLTLTSSSVIAVVSMVSVREGFGLVVLEGLACGKPVVVSEIEPFTEYLDEHACVWADPGDVDSIADALRDALSGRRVPDFVHAVPAVLNRYSWEASARRHLDIYRARLAQRARVVSTE